MEQIFSDIETIVYAVSTIAGIISGYLGKKAIDKRRKTTNISHNKAKEMRKKIIREIREETSNFGESDNSNTQNNDK